MIWQKLSPTSVRSWERSARRHAYTLLRNRLRQTGEIKHLPLKESDLKYVELLRALRDKGVAGMVICESPNLEDDALLLKETYEGLPKG